MVRVSLSLYGKFLDLSTYKVDQFGLGLKLY